MLIGTSVTKLPAETPAVTLPPVWTPCHECAVAQPPTSSIVTIDGGADEERTPNENTSAEGMKEYRSVEPMDEERSVKMTDKRVAGGKAEVAKPKTAKVSEPAAAEVAKPAAAEVSEPPTAETMATTKAHQRCCCGIREIGRRKSRRAYPVFRERQSGERKGRHYKLMLEHWTSPRVTTTPVRCFQISRRDTDWHVRPHFRQQECVAHNIPALAGVSS